MAEYEDIAESVTDYIEARRDACNWAPDEALAFYNLIIAEMHERIREVNEAAHTPAVESMQPPNRNRGQRWCAAHNRAEYTY